MLSKSFSNLDADLKEASLLLSFRWINFHWLGGFWRHRNIQSSFGGFVLLPGFFNNHPMAGFMASLFWWRNQVHPDANTSREGKTVLSSCSCLGQGWDSPWLILGWREWEWKDRHKISIKQSGLLWFFFFSLAIMRDLSVAAKSWFNFSFLVLPFGEGQIKSHHFIPFLIPKSPKKAAPLSTGRSHFLSGTPAVL